MSRGGFEGVAFLQSAAAVQADSTILGRAKERKFAFRVADREGTVGWEFFLLCSRESHGYDTC